MVIGTSLTFYRGAQAHARLLERLRATTGLPVSTMSQAVVDGLRSVDARRIAVATAYADEVNKRLGQFLSDNGFEVLALEGFGLVNFVGQGVVAGIADYGNKMGIPTVNGATLFDPGYVANPLVFCGTVGRAARPAPTQPRVGDLIVVAGGRAGRDGIHGATFSSDAGGHHRELGSERADRRSHRREAPGRRLAARDATCTRAITDCGAGGLSSAVGEMASELGADVELARVPLKYDGCGRGRSGSPSLRSGWCWPCRRRAGRLAGDLCRGRGRGHGDRPLYGRRPAPGPLRWRRGRRSRLWVPPRWHAVAPMESVWSPRPGRLAGSRPGSTWASCWAALADANVASKETIVRQYDHEVQGRTSASRSSEPDDIGPADAAVLRPLARSWRGLAVGCGINPWYGEIDPYAMACSPSTRRCATWSPSERTRRAAILDNFCWGNPQLPRSPRRSGARRAGVP